MATQSLHPDQDALLLTADSGFNPNAVSGDSSVALYQEAEVAGQFDLPWKSYNSVQQILAGTALVDVATHTNVQGYDLNFYPARCSVKSPRVLILLQVSRGRASVFGQGERK